MSAYGAIARPQAAGRKPLVPRTYALPRVPGRPAAAAYLTVVPVSSVDAVPKACADHLTALFDAVVREGRTYPQETELGPAGFQSYFLSHDLFVGILDDQFQGDVPPVLPNAPASALTAVPASPLPADQVQTNAAAKPDVGVAREDSVTVASLQHGRPWGECVAGMFYVKPNYPGRSSHVCNGGFVVDPTHRGLKIGQTLGQSFCYYVPQLGYRASVFNLVYATNLASLAIWDRLGFTRAGLIPRAGRLRTADGKGEEYADAVIYWKSFE